MVEPVAQRTTTRDEGDFAVDAEPRGLADRRRAVADLPWVWLRQVHGADVVVVAHQNLEAVRGSEADALVTTDAGVVLAVQTADCVPVALHGDGVVALAHAGWRGVEAGVLDRVVEVSRGLGAGPLQATIGPHIHAECYEFGADELDRLAHRFGARARGVTATGSPALDLTAVCVGELARLDVEVVSVGECTACHPERWYSYRARGEPERMATVVWRDG
jgi:YfiH family protein